MLDSLAARPLRPLTTSRAAGAAGLLGGAASLGAYGIVLWAMTRAPIAAVAALRETSVLFAALIGALWLKEGFGLATACRRGQRGRRRRGVETMMHESKLPTQARVVIVGGGIAGVSTAYHLAKLGVKDVVLLEQGKLTCGTTWHAAGLVGQTRATRNATRMSRYGIELYASLEKETGLATGWKQCGSLNVAGTPERLVSMKRQMARAKSFGIEFEFISPAEAGQRVPILRTDDLAGAVWIPGDGKANPTDLTQSLAKGARMRGATIVEGVRVEDVEQRQGPRHRRTLAKRRATKERLRARRSSTAAASGRARSGGSPASTCRFMPPSTSIWSPSRSPVCRPTCR